MKSGNRSDDLGQFPMLEFTGWLCSSSYHRLLCSLGATQWNKLSFIHKSLIYEVFLLLIEESKPLLGRREMYKTVIYLSSSAFFLCMLCLSYVVLVNHGNDLIFGEISPDWTVNFPGIVCVTTAYCLSSAIFYLLTCVTGKMLFMQDWESWNLSSCGKPAWHPIGLQWPNFCLFLFGLTSLHPEMVLFRCNLNICYQGILIIQDDMISVV